MMHVAMRFAKLEQAISGPVRESNAHAKSRRTALVISSVSLLVSAVESACVTL